MRRLVVLVVSVVLIALAPGASASGSGTATFAGMWAEHHGPPIFWGRTDDGLWHIAVHVQLLTPTDLGFVRFTLPVGDVALDGCHNVPLESIQDQTRWRDPSRPEYEATCKVAATDVPAVLALGFVASYSGDDVYAPQHEVMPPFPVFLAGQVLELD